MHNAQLSIDNCQLSIGLLGYPLSHSFSKKWFEQRGYRYENFEFSTVEEFLTNIPSDLDGFNVTIPHKQAIIKYLVSQDEAAIEIGAVNCVITTDLGLRGFNTDYIGFLATLQPLMTTYHRRAAILGSGGASRAVQYVMRKLGVTYDVISRSDGGYDRFNAGDFQIIVNTTPVGMYPNVDDAPSINYDMIDDRMICCDLIYNPVQTKFLRHCRSRGAIVINGLTMLHAQAEAALSIFVHNANARLQNATK